MKQNFPFCNALPPVLTTHCLTSGDIFEILSYQKLGNKKLATGRKLCAKNANPSIVIKNFPALPSQRFKNISWGMHNFKRKRLEFFSAFLNCFSKLYHNLLQYIKFKKNRIVFRNE